MDNYDRIRNIVFYLTQTTVSFWMNKKYSFDSPNIRPTRAYHPSDSDDEVYYIYTSFHLVSPPVLRVTSKRGYVLSTQTLLFLGQHPNWMIISAYRVIIGHYRTHLQRALVRRALAQHYTL